MKATIRNKTLPTLAAALAAAALTTVPARGAPWTPADLGSSSLGLWLDAGDAGTITLNGSTVSQWNDKSGNNRHVAQATATKQPLYANNILNGLSAVSFDGSDDSLFASAATITLSQPVHRFIACKFLTKTSKSVVFDSNASPGFFSTTGKPRGNGSSMPALTFLMGQRIAPTTISTTTLSITRHPITALTAH